MMRPATDRALAGPAGADVFHAGSSVDLGPSRPLRWTGIVVPSPVEDVSGRHLSRDLLRDRKGLWSALDVPPGGEPVADICRRIAGRLDTFSGLVFETIVEEISRYGDGSVPPPDLRDSVAANLEMGLLALAENRTASAEEIEVRRELGHRRAAQGMAVDSVLRAYHIGYRALWSELVAEAARTGTETSELLLSVATTAWTWLHQVTDAVAAAHRETNSARESFAIGLRQHLVELLFWGDLESPELRSLTESLGMDPAGDFLAVYLLPDCEDPTSTARLQLQLADVPGVHYMGTRRRAHLLFSQRPGPDQIVELAGRLAPGCLLGIGLTRKALPGARASLGDAERALAATLHRGGAAAYEEIWPIATVLQEADRLRPLLARAIAVARDNPDLAQAVEAYAQSGFSFANAGRKLFVHANTVIYRLDRWSKLTGWDPRSWDGLMKSMIALGVCGANPEMAVIPVDSTGDRLKNLGIQPRSAPSPYL
jgi:hypothetical protein